MIPITDIVSLFSREVIIKRLAMIDTQFSGRRRLLIHQPEIKHALPTASNACSSSNEAQTAQAEPEQRQAKTTLHLPLVKCDHCGSMVSKKNLARHILRCPPTDNSKTE